MRRRLLGAAATLLVVVLLTLPVFSTLQPAYYGRYRELRARMDHWRTSTHGKMACIDCHVDPGTASLILFGGRSVPAFYSQLLQGPSETNLLSVPSRSACRKCHTAYRAVSPAGDLRIPHKAHVEVLKIDCAECHEDLVHSANERGFNRPRMVMCLERCHDGEKATTECTKCHTRKQTPDSHERPDWLEVHSEMTEEIDCAECHAWSPDYCEKCHTKRPSSHAGNWKKDHAAHAERRGKGCLVCHGGQRFCKRCHD